MKRSHSTELNCKFCGERFGSSDDRGLQGHESTCPRRRHAQPEPMADIRTDKGSASEEEWEDPERWFVFDGVEADLEESARAHRAHMEHERTSKVWHCRSESCPFYKTRVTPAFGTFDSLVCSFCCRPVIEGPVADYILLQSIGAINVDKEAGDGGYSQWMLSHFKEEPTRCVGTCRLEFKGGNKPDYKEMALSFNEQLSKHFHLLRRPLSKIVLLNWHVRITGKPNAWTGRGAGETLPTIRSVCKQNGLSLRVVYTVHEKETVGGYIPDADAIITLNPDVRKAMIELRPGTPVYLSKVPNLLESAPTRSEAGARDENAC
ncbi:MAG: hypothetical protein EOO70_10055 [Myxococcaceae bacterium]|nr:MAG: hypothetical protein EOO70_10055 [Myxococcaceae bacterium]